MENENKFIKHIAEIIAIELLRLEELKDWAQRQRALLTEVESPNLALYTYAVYA
ncbi:hypothetical protein [Shewanella sp. yb_14]|uniref:hypothetical protein n=1 Tax=Shewanella sp. yb_14 TaxID=3367224 RepID=UPI00370B51FC